jgi:hypothetical protein
MNYDTVAEFIHKGRWYKINEYTVKCIEIIKEDIIIGLVFSEIYCEPKVKLFTMNNVDNTTNELEPIMTFSIIDEQAFICWSNYNSYDAFNMTSNH